MMRSLLKRLMATFKNGYFFSKASASGLLPLTFNAVYQRTVPRSRRASVIKLSSERNSWAKPFTPVLNQIAPTTMNLMHTRFSIENPLRFARGRLYQSLLFYAELFLRLAQQAVIPHLVQRPFLFCQQLHIGIRNLAV